MSNEIADAIAADSDAFLDVADTVAVTLEYKNEDLVKWLTSPAAALGGVSPAVAIADGDYERVIGMLEANLSDSG